MKREIEFRGKRIDNEEWVYGDLEYSRIADAAFIHTYGPTKAYAGQFRVDPDTVGEYTGLNDKNDKKIFEGDILCTNSTVLSKLIVHWFERCGGFFLSDNKDKEASSLTPIYSANLYKYVVIGNIYDNPELLEGGKQ